MADPHANSANPPSVFSLVIRSKSSLYAAWIPLLKGGGLFLPSNKDHKLGDEVIVLLSLLDEPTKVPLAGHVSWINPAHAAGNRPQGIGIALADTEAGRELKKKIEGLLAGALQSSRPTNTI